MARQITSKLGLLEAKKTLFLLCDIQEKFRPSMRLFDPMIQNTKKLVSLAVCCCVILFFIYFIIFDIIEHQIFY